MSAKKEEGKKEKTKGTGQEYYVFVFTSPAWAVCWTSI